MHDNFVSLATHLIKKNGRSIELVQQVKSNSAWGGEVVDGPVAIVIAVETKFENREVDGRLVHFTDKKFLIDSAVRPTEDMILRDSIPIGVDIIPLGQWRAGIDPYGVGGLVDDPIRYDIISINELKPGETTIMYTVQARI